MNIPQVEWRTTADAIRSSFYESDLPERGAPPAGELEGPADHDGHLQAAGRGAGAPAPAQPGGRRPGRPLGPWRAGQGGLRLPFRALPLLAARVGDGDPP